MNPGFELHKLTNSTELETFNCGKFTPHLKTHKKGKISFKKLRDTHLCCHHIRDRLQTKQFKRACVGY